MTKNHPKKTQQRTDAELEMLKEARRIHDAAGPDSIDCISFGADALDGDDGINSETVRMIEDAIRAVLDARVPGWRDKPGHLFEVESRLSADEWLCIRWHVEVVDWPETNLGKVWPRAGDV